MRRWPVIVLVGLLTPTTVSAWDNFVAHEKLADAAITAALTSPGVASNLQENLLLPKGVTQPVAIQLGFDAAIDADISPTNLSFDRSTCAPDQRAPAGSRLTDNLNKGDDEFDPFESKFPSRNIAVVLNPACVRTNQDYPQCVKELCRSPVQDWIQLGTFAEDNPNARAQHHFHDPVYEHTPPAGNHGMDNHSPLLLGLDALIADAYTTAFRGGDTHRFWSGILGHLAWWSTESDTGNFGLRGLSAVDRALNTPRGTGGPPSEKFPKNLFALPDAERYLYRAVTAPYADERESFATLYFLALGHVLHLLQDMGSVAHTRNDFIRDHVILRDGNLEKAPQLVIDKVGVAQSVLASINTTGDQSVPYKKLLDYAATPEGAGLDLSPYDATLGLEAFQGLLSREASDLFDEDLFSDATGRGLAEYVDTHFFSAGTINTAVLSGAYPSPTAPRCGDVGETTGTGADRVFITELPERDLGSGAIKVGSEQVFVSSPAVPHLARCRLHSRGYRKGAAKLGVRWGATVIDESVQRDYLELIWPRVIQMTAAFLTSQLSPRLEVVPLPDGSFRLANASPFDLEFDSDAIELAYDTLDDATGLPKRVVAPLTCPGASNDETLWAASEPGKLGTLSTFTCRLPTADELLKPALVHDSFWIVIRGKLGRRGLVGKPDEFNPDEFGKIAKDSVVAMRHVYGRRLVMHQNSNAKVSLDTTRISDVKIYSFSIDDAAAAAASGPPIVQELTSPLRPQLAELLDPGDTIDRVDFRDASPEPGGTRLVFGGDVDDDPGESESSSISEFWILNRQPPLTMMTRVDLPPALLPAGGTPEWIGDLGQSQIVYSGNDQGDPIYAKSIVRLDPDDAPNALVSTGTDDAVVVAAHGMVVVGASPSAHLFLMDPETGHRSHVLQVDLDANTGSVVACTSCIGPPGVVERGAAFSPDGRWLVFGARRDTDQFYKLFKVDLQSFSGSPAMAWIQLVSGSVEAGLDKGEGIAWSPDDKWIAFVKSDGKLNVMSKDGGDPIEILPFPGGGIEWLPDFELP